jgi:hypothetical protein
MLSFYSELAWLPVSAHVISIVVLLRVSSPTKFEATLLKEFWF